MIFKRLFGLGGNDEAPDAPLAVVRSVTIGRTIELDTLAWRRLEGAAFKLDHGTLEIVAQGLIKLDEGGSYVHRFYTEDDLMLQAVSPSADGSDADDFTLFKPWSSHFPRRDENASFLRRLEAAAWNEPDIGTFQRFWYEGDEGPQPPVRLWETIYDDRSARSARHIEQVCMLYARQLGETDSELLLAMVMQPDGGDMTHEIMIGVPLSPAEFDV